MRSPPAPQPRIKKLQNTTPYATATDTAPGPLPGPLPVSSPHPPPEVASARWYVLRLRSRHEAFVAFWLESARVESFVPTFAETVRWSDRQKTTIRPLFPGYIFARFDAADPDARDSILRTYGVVQILSIDLKPEPVSDEVVASLRSLVASRTPATLGPYVAGVSVRVERGPFAGRSGIISRVKGATLLTIPVEILGRSVNVQVDAADVKAEAK